MVAQANTTALARIERGEVELADSLPTLTAQLLALEASGEANILSPISGAQAIMPLHAVSLRMVRINPDPGQREVYFDARFCEGRKDAPRTVALAGPALNKLSQAAGVHTERSMRTDDRKEPYFVEHTVTLKMRDYDGNIRQASASKTCDFRDGSPELRKGDGTLKTAGGIADMRRNIASLAETKARFRALRALFNLKQTYSVEELSKPWVVPVLVVRPDPSNPQDREFLLRSSTNLFGPPEGDVTREVKDVTPEPAAEAPRDPPPTSAPPVAARNGRRKTGPTASDLPDEDIELDFSDEEEAPPLLCACPCGCQKDISEAAHATGVQKIGTPRCRDCYPGSTFKFSSMHPGNLDLKIPKHEGMTVAGLERALKRAGRK